ncbi:MAG: SPFH domain-containing protein [Lachnospiraceae bacterium]|nr:SPFH domain-containing protein [Lachnospiraceae bacterium]
MGIIRAAVGSVTGALSDQFLEVVEPVNMGAQTLMTQGKLKNKSGFASSDIISNGSCVHVYDNQFMILTDGGKIIDYTAEPGYFIIDNSSAPSLFQGQFKASLKDVWERFKFNGSSPQSQKVFFINTQEIKGIKFGTRNAINYFDNFYNAELFLRAFGTYSIQVTNPLLFYANACPRNATQLEVADINEQYLNEFLEALQAAINQMSADGERISFVASKSTTLSKYMADVLDSTWNDLRGIEVVSVGIGSISYDEESQKLINMRNQGAMMQDPTIREGYVQSAVAQGLQNAGSNPAGAGAAFMGMGMGMNAAGGFMQSASATNAAQMQQQAQAAPAAAPQAEAAAAGGPRVKQPGEWFCPECGTLNGGKFCMNCGTKKPE